MVDAIKQLREIAKRCATGQPLREDLSQWLADCLQSFLTHRATTIEEALGIQSMRGGVPWWREEAIRQRDALLRLIALRHFADLTVTQKSREICRLARRYADSAWRFDRDRKDMPDRYRNTPLELLFRAFRLAAPMPVCERHLRTILGGLEQAKDVIKEIERALRECGVFVSEAMKSIEGRCDEDPQAQDRSSS
ncbi:MAG: hypothetical protein ACREEP_15175 [Dongiaceae bacterium]